LIVTMGQPGLFPWWGTFAKARVSDLVVHLDHLSWQKGGYLNRFLIGGSFHNPWTTIPLVRPSLGTLIYKMESEPPTNFLHSHLARLRRVTGEPDPLAVDLICEVYETGDQAIAMTAMRSTELAACAVGITTPFLRSSELLPSGRSTEMLLGLLRSVDADAYVFGPGRRGIDQHYLNVGLLTGNGIRVGIAHYSGQPRVSILRDIAERGPDALGGRTVSVEWVN
jgi:hypothetical protein